MSAPRLLDPLSAASGRTGAADEAEFEQTPGGSLAAGRRARDIYLAWLLNLPADVDPSLAATALLAKIENSADASLADGTTAHLRALLEETMSWPREVLAAISPDRPDSGVRRGRERQRGLRNRVRQ